MNGFRCYISCLSVFLCSGIAAGCATITSSETQPVTVSTVAQDGKSLEKADCLLKNESGAWTVKSPSVVSVKRSPRDLMVECHKNGHPDGFARGISRAAGGMWGNIIFGGGIGAIIDHNKGTGYNYPNDFVIVMGKSVTIDRREQNNATETENAGSPAPAAAPPPGADDRLFGPPNVDTVAE